MLYLVTKKAISSFTKRFLFLSLLFFSMVTFGQNASDFFIFKSTVKDGKNILPIEGVTILNKNSGKVVVTDGKGNFEIPVQLNDEIWITHLSYSSNEFKITNTSKGQKQFLLFEKQNSIQEVVITSYKLTGYLEIDTKLIPVEENYRFKIDGLDLGYEPGNKAPNATENLLNALKNPIDVVYQLFNTKEKDLQHLLELKKDEKLNSLLSQSTNREMLRLLLNMNKDEIDRLLQKCNYSRVFINTASDKQVLDALTTSYEEYKVLAKK